jgi:hypothetical protein
MAGTKYLLVHARTMVARIRAMYFGVAYPVQGLLVDIRPLMGPYGTLSALGLMHAVPVV